MYKLFNGKLSSLLLLMLISCASGDRMEPETAPPGDFETNKYWYENKAEITSYTLEQARYGEIHTGQAVFVFVTEDFSKEKQVKLDSQGKGGKDAVSVLKYNLTKKFNTGIYPYSMMTSVFTPVKRMEHPNTLKVTTSSQEWCGHTFTQLNLNEDGYRAQLHSYFESEGEQDLQLDKVVLEDELWNLIRIDPGLLPMGGFDIIPGTMAQRLSHNPLKVEKASAGIMSDETGIKEYIIDFKESGRSLSISYEPEFPHHILGWEETYTSGFGNKAKKLTTKATRNKQLLIDYWTKNSTVDAGLRKQLGLE